jgi:hypothetical protein
LIGEADFPALTDHYLRNVAPGEDLDLDLRRPHHGPLALYAQSSVVRPKSGGSPYLQESQAVKNRYDPDNTFHTNQNILPPASPAHRPRPAGTRRYMRARTHPSGRRVSQS